MRLLLILIFILFFSSVKSQKTVAEMKIDYDVIATNNATQRTAYMTASHGGDSYYWWRHGVADLRALQATGVFTYLDRCLEYWINFQDNAVLASSLPDNITFNYDGTETGSEQYNNDAYLTWENHADRATSQGFTGSSSSPTTRGAGEYPLYEWHGTAWVGMLLAVMYYNPDIRTTDNGALAGSTYETQYQSILSFYQENVWNKWSSRSLDINMFRSVTHIASHPAFAAIFLSKITGLQKYSDYVNAFNYDPSIVGASEANGFRQQLRTQTYSSFGTGYIWNASFGSLNGATDISHSRSGSMKTIASSLKFSDSYWDETDRDRFVANARWAVSVSQNDASAPYRWDGTGLIGAYERNICFGVAMMGAFSPTLQLELESHPLYTATTGVEQELRQEYISELMYNRAYINNELVYPEFETGLTSPPIDTQTSNDNTLKNKKEIIGQ